METVSECRMKFRSVTPYVVSPHSVSPTGRQIRGLFREVAGYISPEYPDLLNEVIFKDSEVVEGGSIEEIRVRSPRGCQTIPTAAGEYSTVFYTKNLSTVEPIVELIGSGMFRIGRGRTHGFGEFELVEFSAKPLHISVCVTSRITLEADRIFITAGRQLKPRIFTDALKSFYAWLTNGEDKLRLPTAYHRGGVHLKFMHRETLFKTVGESFYVIDGRIYSTVKPVTFTLSEEFAVPQISGIWGVGEYVTYGYGTLTMTC